MPKTDEPSRPASAIRSRDSLPALPPLPAWSLPPAWASLLALPLLAGVTVAAQEPPSPLTGVDSAFGYRLNEERRYVLGPADSLAGGEIAEWWISLRSVDRDVMPPVAEFEFGHERLELIPGQWGPAEDLMSVRVEGTLRVSLDGFPLRIDFAQRFGNRGETMAGDSLRRARFTFDGKRFVKELKFGTRDWDFDFAVPRYGSIDIDIPRGLYAWLPTSLACLGSSRRTCIESDPAFANPGFLSLALPTLFEEIDPEIAQDRIETRLVFFTPEVIGASPFRPVAAGGWISRERNNLGNMQRYFVESKLKLGSSTQIEVGPRTLHSWEIEMGIGVERIYVEPGGRVLRVDLETTMDNPDDRWIRLQFPFEEFTSPNADPAERCCPR